MALDRWQRCEVSLGVPYASLVALPGNDRPAKESFGAVTSTTTRASMILTACDAHFRDQAEDGLSAEVGQILTLYKEAASRRNEIAHGVASGRTKPRTIPRRIEWFLVPPAFSKKSSPLRAGQPDYRYSNKELTRFANAFEQLSVRAQNLASAVWQGRVTRAAGVRRSV
jgi:hypothetical protein